MKCLPTCSARLELLLVDESDQPNAARSLQNRGVESLDEMSCCLCGYEPYDPDGIYSEVFDAQMCPECEQIALRVLTTAAEAGSFRVGTIEFEVRRKDNR